MSSLWIDFNQKTPLQAAVLDVVIELTDGSILFCLSQSDGDFYWKPHDLFINEMEVVRWRPQTQAEIDG